MPRFRRPKIGLGKEGGFVSDGVAEGGNMLTVVPYTTPWAATVRRQLRNYQPYACVCTDTQACKRRQPKGWGCIFKRMQQAQHTNAKNKKQKKHTTVNTKH